MAKEDYKGIWIFAEQQNGVLNSVTLELLAKAQELKAHNGEDIYAILLGSDVKALAPTLIAHGADKVIVVVSDIGHARLSVGAKPGRLQGVKPPAGIFGRRGGGMFLLCILLFAQ